MRDYFRAWAYTATIDGGRIAHAWARSSTTRELGPIAPPRDDDPMRDQGDVKLDGELEQAPDGEAWPPSDAESNTASGEGGQARWIHGGTRTSRRQADSAGGPHAMGWCLGH